MGLSSGPPISLSEIYKEYGLSVGGSFSQLKRGGTYVKNSPTTQTIATAVNGQPLRMSDFYGTRNIDDDSYGKVTITNGGQVITVGESVAQLSDIGWDDKGRVFSVAPGAVVTFFQNGGFDQSGKFTSYTNTTADYQRLYHNDLLQSLGWDSGVSSIRFYNTYRPDIKKIYSSLG